MLSSTHASLKHFPSSSASSSFPSTHFSLKTSEEAEKTAAFPLVHLSPVYQWKVQEIQSDSCNDTNNVDSIERKIENFCVFYDEIHNRLIHKDRETLLVVDLDNSEALARDGFFIKIKEKFLDFIRFSPDGNFFIVCSKRSNIKIGNTMSDVFIDVNTTFRDSNNFCVFAAFWLPQIENSFALFVVLSSLGIEIFKLRYEDQTVKLHKSFNVASNFGWFEASSGFAILAIDDKTLQPFLLFTNNPTKLTKIELNLPQWHGLQPNDVSIITIYSQTYCIHKDSVSGRVSLRCLSSSSSPDFVIDLIKPGALEISLLKDLLVVHRMDEMLTFVYDINQEGETVGVRGRPISTSGGGGIMGICALTPICNPAVLGSTYCYFGDANSKLSCNFGQTESALSPKKEERLFDLDISSYQIKSDSCRFIYPDIMIDDKKGYAFRLQINIDAILCRNIKENLSMVYAVEILLNRIGCRERLIALIFQALLDEVPLTEISIIFTSINIAYRKAIEKTLIRMPDKNNKRATVALETLLQYVGNQAILTEKDVVLYVFYPLIAKDFPIQENEELFEAILKRFKKRDIFNREDDAIQQQQQEKSGIEIEENTKRAYDEQTKVMCDKIVHNTSRSNDNNEFNLTFTTSSEELAVSPLNNEEGMCIPSSSYILNCILEYMRTLLNLQILPHRILQTFVFDACILFREHYILRQLFQYHILLDSIDLTQRLFKLWNLCKDPWIEQACLDIALRQREWNLLVDMLVSLKQYLEVIPLLKKHNVSTFPLNEFLRVMASDVDAQKEDPDLLHHILSSIKTWFKESKDKTLHVCSPNLKDCGRWLLDIQTLHDELKMSYSNSLCSSASSSSSPSSSSSSPSSSSSSSSSSPSSSSSSSSASSSSTSSSSSSISSSSTSSSNSPFMFYNSFFFKLSMPTASRNFESCENTGSERNPDENFIESKLYDELKENDKKETVICSDFMIMNTKNDEKKVENDLDFKKTKVDDTDHNHKGK